MVNIPVKFFLIADFLYLLFHFEGRLTVPSKSVFTFCHIHFRSRPGIVIATFKILTKHKKT